VDRVTKTDFGTPAAKVAEAFASVCTETDTIMSETATLSPQRRLGRGLSALLGGSAPAYAEQAEHLDSELRQIPTHALTSNPFQPRQVFDAEALGELSASIKEHGILQPLLVREVEGGYQLIAGERRWQAAQKAGLVTVPCRVVDVIDKTACEFALEENLKRKDLSDLEKAQAFRDYLNQFECSIEELARQLSMNRSTVSNMLRLLELSAPVKNALNAGKISAGHARALLPLDAAEQIELAGRIQAEQLTVRQVESEVKKRLGRGTPAETESVITTPAPEAGAGQPAPDAVSQSETHSESESAPTQAPAAPVQASGSEGEQSAETLPFSQTEEHRTPHVESLEGQLRDLLGVKVDIQLSGRDCGQIVVSFSNNQEFERVLGILRRNAA
jgi:ParB family chromosome partitioning protein